MGRAPAAIRAAADRITAAVPGAVFSGIVGDASHSFGYHIARDELPDSDASVQLPLDRQGPGDAASALDISLPPEQMTAVTARLQAAALAGDQGLAALREFAGTLDGWSTYAYDLADRVPEYGWDSSHLWHIHLSGYRAYADDYAAWDAIAAVFIGEDDMPSAQEVAEAVWSRALATKPSGAQRADVVLAGVFDRADEVNVRTANVDPVIRQTFNLVTWTADALKAWAPALCAGLLAGLALARAGRR